MMSFLDFVVGASFGATFGFFVAAMMVAARRADDDVLNRVSQEARDHDRQ